MLTLEGSVNGRRITRVCETADSAVTEAALVLDGCPMHELRMLQILKSLHSAACGGRTWGWGGADFSLSLHGQPISGA